MGLAVLVLGESGSGKTYSLKHMDPKMVGVFSVKKGTLPFPEGMFDLKIPNDLAEVDKRIRECWDL